jgi:hypothetical protein
MAGASAEKEIHEAAGQCPPCQAYAADIVVLPAQPCEVD